MRWGSAGLLACALLGCAHQPASVLGTPPDDCARQLSARGSARPLVGFPGLSSNRFLGSLIAEIEAEDSTGVQAWLARARGLALHDGGPAVAEPLNDDCGQWWRQKLTTEPALLAQLRAAAQVGSEYSNWQRVLGLYPLAVPGLKLGISGYQADFLRRWGRVERNTAVQAYALPASDQLAEAAEVSAKLRALSPDLLGVPVIGAKLAAEMASAFAPRFLVEVQGPYDEPGAPRVQPLPGVAEGSPILSWRLDFTRAHGQVLAQISWVVWFDRRPEQGWPDWYAGPLDGLVWRATFGVDGWPVAYDTIHPCGCYHLVFPTRHAALDPGGGFFDEARLQPPAALGRARPGLLIESKTHYLRGVIAMDAVSPPPPDRPLSLEPWVRTRQRLSDAIGANGVIRGSERLERLWLWPSGVRSPGAMRDWGRQATAFVGQQHFDDPFVLQPYLDPALFPRVR